MHVAIPANVWFSRDESGNTSKDAALAKFKLSEMAKRRDKCVCVCGAGGGGGVVKGNKLWAFREYQVLPT